MNKAVLKPLVRRARRKRFKSAGKRRIIPVLKKYVTPRLSLKCISAFLLSGTSLIGGACPLGYALFAACFGGSDGYFCAAAALLGLLAGGASLPQIGKYIIAMILFSLVNERFLPRRLHGGRARALTSAVSLLLSGVFILFITASVGGYPLIYDFVVLIVECATAWLAASAFSISVPLVFSLNIRRSLTAEETVSLAFFAGGVICGLGKIQIGGLFSVTETLCVLTVLVFATRFGSMQGCTAGIVMGIICCLSRGRIDAGAASFAVSGLCAGYFAKHGKWAACVSFIMSNAVITVLANGSTEVLINIFDTVVAGAILYCVPAKVFDAICNIGTFTHPGVELAADKLGDMQSALKCCEKSFRKIYELQSSEESNRILLYRRTAHKICTGCGLRKYCWGRDSISTKKSMNGLLEKLRSGAELTAEDAPTHCLRGDRFIGEFISMYEIYKTDCVWAAKISELQSAVYDSFGGISHLMEISRGKLLSMPECDSVCADDIKCRLRREGIAAKSVFVSGSGDGTKIRVTLESCGGFGRCETTVRKVIDEACGKPFVKLGCRRCGECVCQYVVKPQFSISAAVASAIKTNRRVSGDYALYALVDRTTYAIILCDGMGSGESAREESRTCASMLMRMLETGMEPQDAMNMVNSMLLCASTGTLAAIDLCLVSLTDGSSCLYKCGGASTYAKTDGSVTLIDSASLPAGAVTSGDTGIFEISSKQGSMIVLVSDGVTTSENVRAPWIESVISEYDGTDPEPLARLILDRAKSSSHKEIRDDITVVAAFIG